MNFKDYKTNARYAEQINAGYSARLNGYENLTGLMSPVNEEAIAFHHGYTMAVRHEQTNRREK